MEYLIPAALLVLLVAGFVAFVSLYSVRKGGPGEADRNAGDSRDVRPGMGADSRTPFGDTDQHSDAPEGIGESTGSGRFESAGQEDRDRRPESEKLADRGV